MARQTNKSRIKNKSLSMAVILIVGVLIVGLVIFISQKAQQKVASLPKAAGDDDRVRPPTPVDEGPWKPTRVPTPAPVFSCDGVTLPGFVKSANTNKTYTYSDAIYVRSYSGEWMDNLNSGSGIKDFYLGKVSCRWRPPPPSDSYDCENGYQDKGGWNYLGSTDTNKFKIPESKFPVDNPDPKQENLFWAMRVNVFNSGSTIVGGEKQGCTQVCNANGELYNVSDCNYSNSVYVGKCTNNCMTFFKMDIHQGR